MDDIVLRDVTVRQSDEIKNIVTVTGQQKILVEIASERDLPAITIEEPLAWWDPRRLFGKTTREIEIPNTEGWELSLFGLLKRDNLYERYEYQSRTYNISSTYLEMSPEEE